MLLVYPNRPAGGIGRTITALILIHTEMLHIDSFCYLRVLWTASTVTSVHVFSLSVTLLQPSTATELLLVLFAQHSNTGVIWTK